MNSISSRNSRINSIKQSKQKLSLSRDQEEHQPETPARKPSAKRKLPSPKPIDDTDEQDRTEDLETSEALNRNSSSKKSQKPEKREGQEIVIR